MKFFYILLFLLPIIAKGALPIRLADDVIFGKTAKPEGTDQALGDTTHRWSLWTNFINGSAPLPSSRLINTTAPLTGGGDLSADRTLAIPAASSSVDGYLSSAHWSLFNGKEPAITATTSADYYRGDKTFQTLNTSAVPEGTNLYYTDARARAALSGTAPISYNSGTGAISCIVATGSVAGCLDATDFTTFAAKQAALSTSSAVATQFVTGFTAPNTFTRAQPSFSDISGQASLTTQVTGLLPNANLANPSTTVNGQTCTLGSTCTISAGASPLTTKGDLYGFSTVDARVPVGADTFVLTADSTQALGIKWAAPSGGGGSGVALSQPYTIAAHGFVVGDVLRCSSPTVCAKAQADADSTSEALGIVATVPTAGTFTLSQIGYLTGLSGLTANTTYYLSATTAGALTATEPTTVGHISKPMFFADSTTTGYVFQMRGQVITAAAGGGSRAQISYSDQTAGIGSTNTKVMKWATARDTTWIGDLTYVETAANGGHVLIGSDGLYDIAITWGDGNATTQFGFLIDFTGSTFTMGGAELTGNIRTQGWADGRRCVQLSGLATGYATCSYTTRLSAGAKIWFVTNSGAVGSANSSFTVAKVSN